MPTYFISDLHLEENNSTNYKLLGEFFAILKPGDDLFILGDLFALYLGDDLLAENGQEIVDKLAQLTARGVTVQIMHGNRDFLLGNEFCAAAKCKLLPDPAVIIRDGNKILLTHGDRLCTKDTGYQKFRKFVQQAWVKNIFLCLPKKLRSGIANWVKNRSNRNNAISKINLDKYDAVANEVAEWCNKYQSQFMIHGHTHKPGMHQHGYAIRYILGDWTDSSAKIVRYQDGKFAQIDLRSHLTLI